MFSNLEENIIQTLKNYNNKNTIYSNYDQWNPFIKLYDNREYRLIEFVEEYRDYKLGEYLKPCDINENSSFLNFEGIDNSGKSTCIKYLKQNFDMYQYTKEPDDSEWIGKQVRNCLNSKDSNPITVFYLFLADHVNHLNNTVKPALRNGSTILCDRYIFSRYAYQSYTLRDNLEKPLEKIRYIHETGNWTVMPSMVVYLDVSVENSMKRMEGEKEKYENKKYLKKIRQQYNKLSDIYSDEFVKIDTNNKTQEEVLSEIERILDY